MYVTRQAASKDGEFNPVLPACGISALRLPAREAVATQLNFALAVADTQAEVLFQLVL